FAPEVQIARLRAVEASDAPPIAPVVATTPPPELGPSLRALARQRWKWLVASAAAVTLGWVLRPQPRTDRQDSPWLAGIATAAAGPGESVVGYTDAVARGNDLFRQGKYAAAADEDRKALAVRPQS